MASGIDPLGERIHALADLFADLKSFKGQRFQFTTSEFRSAVLLMEAIERHPAYGLLIQALEKRREDSPGEKEIARALKPAVQPLADFLAHHDPERVERA